MRNYIICAVLFLVIGFYCANYINYYRYKTNPFNIENLKKAEIEFKEDAKRPNRAGKINERKLSTIELNENFSLARADVSEFFKKDVPLNELNLPHSYLFAWVALAVSDIMTFGFNDYEYRLSLASDYFTEDGWKSFSTALERNGILDDLKVNQQFLTAAPNGAPVLQAEHVVNGVKSVSVQVPLVITYRSGARSKNRNLLVTVIVKRTNNAKYPYGIAIDQWIAVAR